jgi:hypothetical protein
MDRRAGLQANLRFGVRIDVGMKKDKALGGPWNEY